MAEIDKRIAKKLSGPSGGVDKLTQKEHDHLQMVLIEQHRSKIKKEKAMSIREYLRNR
jgi:hypothetical protein